MSTREKIPHTARFLMTFHTAGAGLPAEIGHPAPAVTRAASAPRRDVWASAPATPASTFRPSAAQAELMAKLITELEGLDASAADEAHAYMERMQDRWTPGKKGTLSTWIDRLISKVKAARLAAREAQRAARAAAPELEDGMYVLDGVIFKVVHAVHGSGNQYAKRFVAPAAPGERATFEFASGVVRKLRAEHKMALEEAVKFGQLYGVCVRCGAVLTDETSIEAAMGRKCRESF